MQSGIKIPLFPLGLVLLPQMPLPLHIFEERYKLMIGECLEKNEEFGIVYFNGTDIQAIGCTASIHKVVKRYNDGRLDILTRGDIAGTKVPANTVSQSVGLASGVNDKAVP